MKFKKFSEQDKYYMHRAINLALKGNASPNPKVGCVIVKNNEIIAEGYHKKAGMPHAEIVAINDAKTKKRNRELKGSTMYVTLEPCCHTGRTPPCCNAIIKNNVTEVVIAMKDPNPIVFNKGIKKLKKAGIKIREGLLEKQAKEINKAYIKHTLTGNPYIILKQAISLDGKIATKTGDSKWISNNKSREYVHNIRANVDAIIVGIGTVLKDNPRLTCRITKNRDPIRIILDSKLKIPLNSKVLKDNNVIIATTNNHDKAKYKKLINKVKEIIICKSKKKMVDLIDLNYLTKELGKRNIQSVMIEAGKEIATSSLKYKIIDQIIYFISPILIGEGKNAVGDLDITKICNSIRLRNIKTKKIGDNILIQGEVKYE